MTKPSLSERGRLREVAREARNKRRRDARKMKALTLGGVSSKTLAVFSAGVGVGKSKIKIFKVVKSVDFTCHIYATDVAGAQTDAKFHMPEMYWDRTDMGFTITEVKQS